jgi:integrase
MSYAAAEAGSAPIKIGAKRVQAGSVAAVVNTILASAEFAALAEETRRTRRNLLKRFCGRYGDHPVAPIERRHVQAIIDSKAATPSAARNWLAMIRIVMKAAIKAGLRESDPTIGVKRPKIKGRGYQTWEEEHIAQFLTAHPAGSRARLALMLLICTGQRRGDVVTMGRQHIRAGKIAVRQKKTGEPLLLPILPELRVALETTTTQHLTFLTTRTGKPFTPAGFTNWFRDMCNVAGLPNGLSAHGLRKAMCRRLAEAGCSSKLIAAVSGHQSLRMVQHYTEAADQSRMAEEAISRLARDAS